MATAIRATSDADPQIVGGRGRRRRVILLTGIVLGAALIAYGFSKWRYMHTHASTDDAFVAGHLVPVLARVGGYVQSVSVSENQHVTEGQELVVLDDAELRQREALALAELHAAEAASGGAGQSGALLEQARSQQATLSARISAARARAEFEQRNLERMKQLAEQQIVSKQQLDAAYSAAGAARDELRALEQQAAGARAGITGAQAGARQASSRVLAAQAALEQARLQLSYAHVLAPVSGQVAKRSVEPGQLLQPGQPLMTIVADTGVYVTANFKETQLGDIRAGQAVSLDVDAYPSCEVRGRVQSIGGATGSQFALLPPENATGNFTKVVQRVPIRIQVLRACGDARPLRPGMSVTAHVSTRR